MGVNVGGTVKVRQVKVWGLGSAAAGFSRDKKSSSLQEHMKEFHSIPFYSMFYTVPFLFHCRFQHLVTILRQIFVLELQGLGTIGNAKEKIMKICRQVGA